MRGSVVVIIDERITAVGKCDDIRIPERSEIIDASGKTVLPGFIDSHTHFLSMGIDMSQIFDLSKARSIDEVLDTVREKVVKVEPGDWIIGRGWDESNLSEIRYINIYKQGCYRSGNIGHRPSMKPCLLRCHLLHHLLRCLQKGFLHWVCFLNKHESSLIRPYKDNKYHRSTCR